MRTGTNAAPGPVALAARERRALLYGLGSVLLWSTVATGFKLGLRELAPVQLLFAGCVVALVFFGIVRCFTTVRLTPKQRWQALALGLMNPLAYYLLLFEAYDRLPAQVAQPLNYTWAIALALLAIPLLGQRPTRRGWYGVLLGYAGVVVLLTKGELAGLAHFDSLGVAFALASTLLWATYWLATVRLAIPPAALLLYGFALATPLVGILCYATAGLPPWTLPTIGYGAWVGLVEIGVAFLLWQRALALTAHAARIGQLIFLSPFLSLVLVATVLEEQIHPSAVVALAMIVGALMLARRQEAKKEERAGA